MNILLLYANDPFTTGGSIPVDLLNEFKKRGHKARLLVDHYQPNYPEDIVSVETKLGLRKKNFFKRVRRRWGLMQNVKAPTSTIEILLTHEIFFLVR